MSTQYVDFTLDGVSSRELGLKRVSDGSRYREEMLPPISPLVAMVPGVDGSYYFGSTWGDRRFQLECVFDDMRESQVRQIKAILSKKGLIPLVFSEYPYKQYMVRVDSEPYFEYVPFAIDERTDRGRIYRGELRLALASHRPYATSVFKDLSELGGVDVSEWNEAANLIDLSQYDQPGVLQTNIYNPGDLPTDVKIYFTFPTSVNLIQLGDEGIMKLGALSPKGDDIGFFYNSETHLLEGFKGSPFAPIKSSNIYNEAITAGSFFKIPKSTRTIPNALKLKFEGGTPARIEYEYRYF